MTGQVCWCRREPWRGIIVSCICVSAFFIMGLGVAALVYMFHLAHGKDQYTVLVAELAGVVILTASAILTRVVIGKASKI